LVSEQAIESSIWLSFTVFSFTVRQPMSFKHLHLGNCTRNSCSQEGSWFQTKLTKIHGEPSDRWLTPHCQSIRNKPQKRS